MKNQWIHFFYGYVTAKVTGKGLERFLNRLSRQGILIWNVRRIDEDTITFQLVLNKLYPLRRAVRKSNLSVHFIDKHGFPFLLKRLFFNSGFLVGFVGFFVLLFLLSNMIWGIQIEGAGPKTEEQISKELDKLGVEVGSLQFLTDSPEEIQRILTNNIPAITWVGVKLDGTVYRLRVVEKNEPERELETGPQHLVATKKGTIVSMYVKKGQPMIVVNDFVRPGQLLVSGVMGTEDKMQYIAAEGQIMAETWYRAEVTVPLKKELAVMTGNEKDKRYIQFGNWDLQIWGFGEPDFKEYEEDTTVHPFQFLRWQLPISYKEIEINEIEKAVHQISESDAVKTGIEIAKKDLLSNLGEEAKIKGENILHKEVQNGKVKLTILFQVIENIAKGQPIIQGD
ncbi:similar to stage IV sporulation protein [Bacillus oleivorans]|uniref:Similar to stage IV sporulation protein n=1 Tax=Bacillus oleivorans TaxID=1448271 RepID=A0A285CLJ0_9BACI|nr:sporulation protein YqfD [Bacillus oleivorans]SNX67873.1 similar to stage IV sporulation protein [Bacillus oleivorans]